jgi:phosphoribosyl 1,2-cyclic phosphodiesterase
MTFEAHYSGSKANLYVVTAGNGKRLIIEAGCTWAKLQKALKYDLSGVQACLISHEHKDHSKAVEDVLTAGIDIYASEGTLRKIEDSLPLHRRTHVLHDRRLEPIGQFFDVFPFAVHHDAAEPLGFIVHDRSSNEHLLFVTDTSHITQRFALAFDIIAIAASYDKDVLAERVNNEQVNETLAKRLLVSHTEWRVAKRYLKEFCDLSRCREIHLLHPSADNMDKQRVRKDIEDSFFIKTFI